MSAKHTPGPWAARKGNCGDEGEFSIKGGVLYIADTIGGMGDEEEEANARLIAAAPDLLEALELYAIAYTDEELRQLAETETGMGEISPTTAKREIIRRAAIAKAKGGQP